MSDATERELLRLTQQLMDCIAARDWKVYAELCDPSLTCFEPEAHGQFVEGLAFHKFYFDLGPASGPRLTTMCSPRVRLMGEVALVTFGRLVQRAGGDAPPSTLMSEETRVWQRKVDGRWKLVHFHRSVPQ